MWEADGSVRVERLGEIGLAAPDGPYETVAGFLAAQLGRVPSVGDEGAVDGYNITVMEMDGRRVSRVRVHLVTAGEPATAD